MEIFDILNVYIIGLAQMLIGFWCFNYFTKRKTKLTYYILFAGISLLEIYLFHTLDFGLALVYTVTLFFLGVFLFRLIPAQSALYSFIVNILMTLIYGIVNCILGMINISAINMIISVISIIIINLAAFFALIMITRLIKKYFIRSDTYSNVYTLIVLIPVILIYLSEEFINYYIFGNSTYSDANIISYSFKPLQMISIELTLLGIIFFNLFVYKKLLESLSLKIQIDNLTLEGKYLTHYAEETQALYDKTHSFRHDVKNHLTVINSLLKERKFDEALTYTNELIADTSHLSFEADTGNPILNVLLKNKLGYAESLNIKVICHLLLPNPCNISNKDLCVIISNAIDNAIEACKKLTPNVNRFIEIRNIIQGDILIFKINNSYNGTKIIKEGTGINNIKTAASKYNGLVEIETDSKIFILKILLNLSQHNNDILRQNI